MPFRMSPPLLRDFPLEPMSLWAFERQAWVRPIDFGAENREATHHRVSYDGDQSNMPILGGGHPEQRRQGAASAHRGENCSSELRNREVGNVLKRNCFSAAK